MEDDEGDTLVPVGYKGVPPVGWLSMTAAVRHTGVPGSTLRRRVDAWLAGDTARIDSGWAVKGVRVYGGRLVDAVDAERVRLQQQFPLDAGRLNAAGWEQMVRSGEYPFPIRERLTDADWWAPAVRMLAASPSAPS